MVIAEEPLDTARSFGDDQCIQDGAPLLFAADTSRGYN